MAKSLPVVKILFLFSLHLLPCVSDNRLTPGQLIPSNETLTSDRCAFVLGFFSPGSTGGDLYLGVWYNIPQRTVIWVANRESPVTGPYAALLFSDDSSLRIVGSRRSNFTFWSPNPPGTATEAVLLNTENLVLRYDNCSVLWQSFDHPTDTFVLLVTPHQVHPEALRPAAAPELGLHIETMANLHIRNDRLPSLRILRPDRLERRRPFRRLLEGESSPVRSECSTNCSCQAFAYADLNAGNATTPRCLVWTRCFVDAEMLSIGGVTCGSSSKSRRKILLHVLSILGAASAFACVFAVWKSCGRSAADQAAPELPLISFESPLTTSLLQHRNLVGLLGYCIHGEEKLLAYEYMPNKSLEFFLLDPVLKTKLDWGKRFNIIKGIARALLYLHQDSKLRIVHHDLKILSFGVLLLEIVSGPRNSSFYLAVDFTHLLADARQLWNEGNVKDFIDPS
ncbi:hypothetical protein ZIOFF_031097 [Zingiber officinale]|uniref:non-specific serine/threonine protein kinase n=1 Tax=Zingiber officinale TaxID=94328 RepID=A0A8J5GRV5_ZINOF|nr:hypothetical protein ZIOFF_031097 [Zingiber officinale]